MTGMTEAERLAKQVRALTRRVQKLENRIKGYDKVIEIFAGSPEPDDWTCRRREREQQRGHLTVVADGDPA